MRFLRQCQHQQIELQVDQNEERVPKNEENKIKPSKRESPGERRPLLNTVHKDRHNLHFFLPPKHDHNVR